MFTCELVFPKAPLFQFMFPNKQYLLVTTPILCSLVMSLYQQGVCFVHDYIEVLFYLVNMDLMVLPGIMESKPLLVSAALSS